MTRAHWLGILFTLALLGTGCRSLSSTTASTTLAPTNLQTITFHVNQYVDEQCSNRPEQLTEPQQPANSQEVLVGHDLASSGSPGGFECTLARYQYRGGIFFDLHKFAAGSVTQATLSFHLAASVQGNGGQRPISCATELEVANVQWQDPHTWDMILGDPYRVLPGVDFAIYPTTSTAQVQVNVFDRSLSVDVTSAVQDWLSQHSPNYGFVLSYPETEQFSVACLAHYSTILLKLK